jgi:hypothetical protein
VTTARTCPLLSCSTSYHPAHTPHRSPTFLYTCNARFDTTLRDDTPPLAACTSHWLYMTSHGFAQLLHLLSPLVQLVQSRRRRRSPKCCARLQAETVQKNRSVFCILRKKKPYVIRRACNAPRSSSLGMERGVDSFLMVTCFWPETVDSSKACLWRLICTISVRG